MRSRCPEVDGRFEKEFSVPRCLRVFYEAALISQAPLVLLLSLSLPKPRCGMGAGPKPSGLLFAFSGETVAHRASCHSHRRCGAISVTTLNGVQTRNALPPPARGFAARRAAGGQAVANFIASNVVPSRQIANKIRL